MTLCPCQSAKKYSSCCAPIIEGKQSAKTAEQLMRSRYSAFALGNKNYLLDSWHKEFKPESLNLDGSEHWVNLQIIKSGTNTVHFKAYSLSGDLVSVLEEKSSFKKVDNQWLYTTGELMPAHQYKISRNSGCVCGSGKKFKRCCGLL